MKKSNGRIDRLRGAARASNSSLQAGGIGKYSSERTSGAISAVREKVAPQQLSIAQ